MRWLIAIALVLCLITVSMCTVPNLHCRAKGDVMGVPVHFQWPGGCFVQVDGRWVPVESYRGAK
jgi:hypothetical protein